LWQNYTFRNLLNNKKAHRFMKRNGLQFYRLENA
jgi:hypothetical protein